MKIILIKLNFTIIKKLAHIMDNFIKYIDTEIKDSILRSPLGKALDYAKKYLHG